MKESQTGARIARQGHPEDEGPQCKVVFSRTLTLRLVCMVLVFSGAGTAWSGSREKKSFQFVGTILQSNGLPFRDVTPVASLLGATAPYSSHTPVDSGGRFKFTRLRAGMYTLTITVPRAGQMRRTVDVGPHLADSNGKVFINLRVRKESLRKPSKTVSMLELSIPKKARKEYDKAQERLAKYDTTGAIRSLKKAVRIAPHFASAWNNLGTIAYQTRNYDQAETYFRRALEQNEEAYPPLVNLAATLLAQGKIKESLQVNLRAVESNADDPLAHSQLGLSYFSLGRLEEAETQLKRAKALDPAHFSFPQLILAEIYKRRKDTPAMIRELEEFVRLHPDAGNARDIREFLDNQRGIPPESMDSNRCEFQFQTVWACRAENSGR